MSEIKKGDVVQLKSGGPKMTVERLEDCNRAMIPGPKDGVFCLYFNDKQEVIQKVFDVAVLKEAQT